MCSGRYGNGAGGALAYVGPCDGSGAGLADVELVLESIEVEGGVTLFDQLTRPADPDFINPCPAGKPCVRSAECAPNRDTPVAFNLTILRDASQGFFDIAVTFEDVFCSAKLDCQYDSGPIVLLHRPDGERDQTAVLAFACTTGSGDVRDTLLHMNDIEIDCGGDVVSLDPTAGPGNVWSAANPDPDPTDPIWQYATYYGVEALRCGGPLCNKLYWNVAIGFDPTARDCSLVASATVSTTTQMNDALTPVASAYPWIAFEGALTADVPGGGLVCDQNPLNRPGSGVLAEYTPVDTQKPFCHRYDGTPPTTASACEAPCVPVTCPEDSCAVIDDGCGGTVDCRPASQPPRAFVHNGSRSTSVGTGRAARRSRYRRARWTRARTTCRPTRRTSPSRSGTPATTVTARCLSKLTTSLGMVGAGPGVVIPAAAFDGGSTSTNPSPALSFAITPIEGGAPGPELVIDTCDGVGGFPVILHVTDQGETSTCVSYISTEDLSCLCCGDGVTVSPNAPTPILHGVATNIHVASNPACPGGGCGHVDVPASVFDAGSYDGETPGSELERRIAAGGPSSEVIRFGCNDLGTQSITLTVTDEDGESASASTFVLIQDNYGLCAICGGTP